MASPLILPNVLNNNSKILKNRKRANSDSSYEVSIFLKPNQQGQDGYGPIFLMNIYEQILNINIKFKITENR